MNGSKKAKTPDGQSGAGGTGHDNNVQPHNTTKPVPMSSSDSLGKIGDESQPGPRQAEVSKAELQSFMDAHPNLSRDDAIRAILATPLGDRIADYHALGWSVIPLLRHSKRAAIPWKRYQEKPPTVQQVAAWRKTHDKSNLAVITGAVSGIFVMDVDSPEGQGEVNKQGVPETVTAKTAKGRHYFFNHPGRHVKNDVRILDGVDIKGDGGYVVLPPSIHPDTGLPYAWEHSPLENATVADAPQWLLDLIEGEAQEKPQPEKSAPISEPPTNGRDPYLDKAMSNVLLELSTAPDKTRNNTLNIAAMRFGNFVAAGRLDQAEAENQLRVVATAIGLDPGEINDTIQSGMTKGLEKPEYTGTPPQVTTAIPEETEPEPAETKTLSLADLMKGPTQIDWLIEPLIPPGAAGLIAGDGGVGKTWLTLDLALATAMGKKWAGHFQCRQGAVLVVDEENSELLLRARLEKLITARAISDTGPIPLYFRVGTGINLSPEKNGNFSASFIELMAEVKRLGVILIVFDSLTRVHRANENQSNEMAGVFAHVRYLMDQTGAACIFNHHMRKAGGGKTKSGERIRGSTDIRNFADFTLLVDKSDNGIKITHDKSRWAEPIDPFEVALNYDALDDSISIAYQGVSSKASKSEYRNIWEWLKELLEVGELSRQTLIVAAEEENVCRERQLDNVLSFRFEKGMLGKRKEGNKAYYHLPNP